MHFAFHIHICIRLTYWKRDEASFGQERHNDALEDIFVAPIGLCQKAASSTESKGFDSRVTTKKSLSMETSQLVAWLIETQQRDQAIRVKDLRRKEQEETS